MAGHSPVPYLANVGEKEKTDGVIPRTDLLQLREVEQNGSSKTGARRRGIWIGSSR